jgi:hypothetical protein
MIRFTWLKIHLKDHLAYHQTLVNPTNLMDLMVLKKWQADKMTQHRSSEANPYIHLIFFSIFCHFELLNPISSTNPVQLNEKGMLSHPQTSNKETADVLVI